MVPVVLLVVLLYAGCSAVPASGPVVLPTTPSPSTVSVAPSKAPSETQAAFERGQALLAAGDMAGAATSLRAALRSAPERVDARAALGLALYNMGDLDGAVEELRAALRQNPDAVAPRLTLASTLIARREWEAARFELEVVLRAHPDLGQAHYSLGVVRYARGDLNGAIDAYRRASTADPHNLDARYNIGLVLKLQRRDAEAIPELLAAAAGGHARAQYFVGTAYATGAGVERNLSLAVRWWFSAAHQGVSQAHDALGQLRTVALGRGRRGAADRVAAEQAFRDYRADLWKRFPELTPTPDASVGEALLGQGRVADAVPILILEAAALGEPAQRLLETLYEQGVDGQLPAHDARILGYLESAAAEGLRPPIR